MAEIPGVTIDWTDYTADPSIARTVHIPAPIVNVDLQDLVDTLSSLQAELDNLIYEPLILADRTGGKTPLEGTQVTPITLTLNHAWISFDARKQSAQEGSVTTADPQGVTLVDSNGDLPANDVGPGSQVLNLTDGSRATILRVLDAQTAVTDGLGDGVDDQFALGDSYEIMNITQVVIAGGNMVAVDQNGNDAPSVLPTAGTQVVRTLSSGAALIDDQVLQQAVAVTEIKVGELWQLEGLDITNPVVQSPNATQSGFVNLTITEGPAGTFTVQRL